MQNSVVEVLTSETDVIVNRRIAPRGMMTSFNGNFLDFVSDILTPAFSIAGVMSNHEILSGNDLQGGYALEPPSGFEQILFVTN